MFRTTEYKCMQYVRLHLMMVTVQISRLNKNEEMILIAANFPGPITFFEKTTNNFLKQHTFASQQSSLN